MKHVDEITSKEAGRMAECAGRGLASIVEILRKEHDLCPRCALGLLLASVNSLIDQQEEVDNSTIN